MNVLFISSYSDLYGANKSLLALILDLKKRYNIVPLVIVPKKGRFTEELNDKKIPYIVSFFFPWTSINDNKVVWKKCVKYLLNVFFYYRIWIKLNDISIDLIHTNSSVTDLGDFLSVKINRPHIWHIREFLEEDYNYVFSYNLDYVKKRFQRAQKVIFISNAVKNKFSQIVNDQNSIVIYNGLDVNGWKNNSHKNNILQFCIVGVIMPSKGQLDVLKAGKKLLDIGITNFEINIFGECIDSTYGTVIHEFINRNSMHEYVKLWGYRRDMVEILDKMDVGIMASYMEAFGRTTVEFMSKHLPVIGAKSGATPEIINDNKNGFLYETGNIQDLAEKMLLFINDRKLCVNMGEEAYWRSLDFSKEKNTDKIYDIYCKIIKK